MSQLTICWRSRIPGKSWRSLFSFLELVSIKANTLLRFPEQVSYVVSFVRRARIAFSLSPSLPPGFLQNLWYFEKLLISRSVFRKSRCRQAGSEDRKERICIKKLIFLFSESPAACRKLLSELWLRTLHTPIGVGSIIFSEIVSSKTLKDLWRENW